MGTHIFLDFCSRICSLRFYIFQYVGVIARRIGGGGDIGFELAFAFTAVVSEIESVLLVIVQLNIIMKSYPAFRFIERQVLGR